MSFMSLPERAPARRGRPPSAGNPNPVDVHVGTRVRLRRTLLGMSQDRLADALDLTFQQVQKYERGINRICASRLFQLSQILDVPIAYFYEELDPEIYPASPVLRRETLELIRAYLRIDDPQTQRTVFGLVKALAGPVAVEEA